ncbi:MAG TPA: acyl-ACP desaturase [Gemmatimonadales bacterium]|jgi:acyl-[acyl-carrier-protein] desaturase|nr:acyl-ACP desaturase [Gemmatimonadales bacterium]
MTLSERARQFFTKVEVLRDLEARVAELMAAHEAKRPLWFPADLLDARPGECQEEHRRTLRERATGIPDPVRAALALNLLTEEGLPHFHRLIAVYLGDDSHWRNWNNLWTAEEDRHGAVLTDYCKSTGILDRRTLEVMQFAYIKAGFEPSWDKDPYRVFAYTTVQERATQVSHANTGRIVGEYEPLLGDALGNVASEEARHYVFYRTMVSEILARDPNEMLHSLAQVMPGIDMPGHTIPGFVQLADVIRRAGIYGPRDYLRIVQDQLKHWKIETLEGLSEMGKKAQEKLLAIPARLERVAQIMETRRTAKTFSFEVVFNREFAMD